MEKNYTEVLKEEYQGFNISIMASYFVDHDDALKEARQGGLHFTDGEKYQAVALALKVEGLDFDRLKNKQEIVKAKKNDFIELNKQFINSRNSLLQFAKDSIDNILHEQEVTEDLVNELREAAYKQSQQNK